MFSFNNPIGACPECAGIGNKQRISTEKLVPHPELSLREGGIAANGFRTMTEDSWTGPLVAAVGADYGFTLDTPLADFTEEQMHVLMYGAGDKKYRVTRYFGKEGKEQLTTYDGIVHIIEKRMRMQGGDYYQEFVEEVPCPRGLDYLNLARTAGTLSGGEAQRIRLATQIGSALTGVLYILDEPSIGLHQRDNGKLIRTLKNLRDIGNSVIVVEHDEETMREADYIVDIGPGAGIHGGEVVAAGTPDEVAACERSITGAYLSGRKCIPVPKTRRPGNGHFLTVHGAAENNLKHIDVSFPLGTFTAVTGVSGSGKSSLVNSVLYKTLAKTLNRSTTYPGKCDGVTGTEYLDKVIAIDQSPIGRTPRSNPATYTGLFTDIRELFARTQDAKARGYDAGRFSFNVRGGRCEACQGDGVMCIEMNFLPDVYVKCEVCKGKRYNRDTLEVRYKGKSIYDVLEMSVEEGLTFFSDLPRLKNKLQTLYDVGLGYIHLYSRRTHHRTAYRRRVQTDYHSRPSRRRGEHGHRHRA